jgi:hypothetical protein
LCYNVTWLESPRFNWLLVIILYHLRGAFKPFS